NLDFAGTFDFGPSSHKLIFYGMYNSNWQYSLGDGATYPGIDTYHPVYFDDPTQHLGPVALSVNQKIFGTVHAYAGQDNISFLKDRLIVVLGARRDVATTTNLN